MAYGEKDVTLQYQNADSNVKSVVCLKVGHIMEAAI